VTKLDEWLKDSEKLPNDVYVRLGEAVKMIRVMREALELYVDPKGLTIRISCPCGETTEGKQTMDYPPIVDALTKVEEIAGRG
jgi:hypothetical protein